MAYVTVFDNIIDSTLLVSLYSSEKIKFAINANVSDSLLIIRNNEINSKNGTMITANKATISNNKINIEMLVVFLCIKNELSKKVIQKTVSFITASKQ